MKISSDFWRLKFSTSAPVAIYWQQTCPNNANFAFPKTQRLKMNRKKTTHFCSKVKSLVCCSSSFPIRPHSRFHSCFWMHPLSRGFGRDPKLSVAWGSPSEALSLVLKERCSRQTKDPYFTLLYSSLGASICPVLCFLAHVFFPLGALVNPTFLLSLFLCFNFFIFLSLIAIPVFGGCKDDWFSRRNRSTNWYHKWLIETSTV